MARTRSAANRPRVWAIIPTFNRKQVLESCLQTLRAQSYPVELVVSDAGSTDGTREALALAADVRLVRGTPDLWWTGSTNLGIASLLEEADAGDYILCINDDVTVDVDYVENLVASARKARRRLVGSLIVDMCAPDIIQDGGVSIDWVTAKLSNPNSGRAVADFSAAHEERVQILPGRGTLISVEALRELGSFDIRLPHYSADYEFSDRCARAGYELVVCYAAKIYSDTTLTGIHAAKRVLSLTEARAFFFSRRSACNLRDRVVFAWLTRRSIPQGLAFFGCTVLRVTWRYLQGERPR